MAAMKVVCGWCGLLIRDGEEPISHGMCPQCYEAGMKRLKEQGKDLEAALPGPVNDLSVSAGETAATGRGLKN